jgi:hypothetical protein
MGLQGLFALIAIGASLIVLPLSARAQDRPKPSQSDHPDLIASLERLHTGSPTWREAIAAATETGRRLFVFTPDKIRVTDASGRARPFDEDVLAEVHPVADADENVNAVIVVINLPLLVRLYSDATMAQMEADLDRIVAHEVYGHAIPYLLSGKLSGKCADPSPGERAIESCAIRRENVIRRELRLGERRGSGLDGLTLARRYRN